MPARRNVRTALRKKRLLVKKVWWRRSPPVSLRDVQGGAMGLEVMLALVETEAAHHSTKKGGRRRLSQIMESLKS
ncbi:unnamed protein product [Boreogadus saida]